MPTVFSLELRWVGTGRTIANAIVCRETRHVSVLWSGTDHVEQRFPWPRAWPTIDRDLEHLTLHTLPVDSALGQLLLPDRARWATIHLLGTHPIDVGGATDGSPRGDRLAEAIETRLRADFGPARGTAGPKRKHAPKRKRPTKHQRVAKRPKKSNPSRR